MDRLNKENKDPYVNSLIVRGHQCDVYMDDYGQCYYFEYLDENNELQSVGCGTYNFNYLEEVVGYFDIKGLTISLEGEDIWIQRMLLRKDRGLKSIDYDDYGVYDFKALYAEFEKEFR